MDKTPLKNAVKNALSVCSLSTLNSVKKSIAAYDVISFDIFETLIFRDVASINSIYDAVWNRCSNFITVGRESFIALRVSTEVKIKKANLPKETNLTEIYRAMDCIESSALPLVCKVEEEIELSCAAPSRYGIALFQYALSLKKHVIIVSDMHLSKCVIERILKKCGISRYSKLYLSSNCACTKRNGELFDYVAKDMGVKKENILHIGNDYKADFLQAKHHGVKSCLLDSSSLTYEAKYIKEKESNIAIFVGNHQGCFQSDFELIGYEVLGPLLISFSWWLDDLIEELGVQRILFLSREGELLKKAYGLVFPKRDDECEYLCVSRRAVLGCNFIHSKSLTDIIKKLVSVSADKLTLDDFIKLGYCTSRSAETFCKKSGLSCEDNLVHISKLNDVMIESLFQKIILPDMISYSKHQRDAFINYFMMKNASSVKTALVDVGWRGSMQDEISDIIHDSVSQDIQIYGLYYGVYSDLRKENQSLNSKYGALFRDGHDRSESFYMLTLTVQFFEMLFLSAKGSTISYSKKDSAISIPIFGTPELDCNMTDAVAKMQNAALKFVSDYCNSGVSEIKDFHFTVGDAFKLYSDLVVHPSYKLTKQFKRFTTKNIDSQPLFSTHNLLYWFSHPKAFKESFSSSYCKLLFLKSCFKVPFPYYSVLKRLKQCQESHRLGESAND